MKKLDFSFIKESFEQESYTLISSSYKNSKTKLQFICPNGHDYKIKWSDWKSGRRCGKCTNLYNIDINIVKQSFEKERYKLLTTEYQNNRQKLNFICPNEHHHYIAWKDWQQGHRCGKCSTLYSITIEKIKEEFEKENYILLTKNYKNANTYLEFICSNGHEHQITWGNWQQGHRCGKCSNLYSITIEKIKEEFEKENYKVITIDYTNSKQKIEFICPNNHRYSITWNEWQQGHRCGKCSNLHSITIEKIKEEFEKEGYSLLITKYQNNRQKLSFVCPNSHHHYITWDIWQRGHRCGRCPRPLITSSLLEKSFQDLLDNFEISYDKNDRNIIYPLELDLIIPDRKIAIELCGLYWHSELLGKGKNYHLNKLKLCNDKDYRLITIFEDEWLNYKDVIINNILKICNINTSKTVYARNCNIKEIKNDIALYFLQQYHLQGSSINSIRIGAFYNEELVAVMTFSRPSIAKGARNQDFWEINRFCTHKDYHIPGIASKLLTYFERNFEWNKIVSYADRRWSEGNLYYKLGFNLVGETPPNYWYLEPNNYRKRIHRFALRKKSDEPKDKTEWELRQEQGYDRIWDCGSLKFEKMIKS